MPYLKTKATLYWDKLIVETFSFSSLTEMLLLFCSFLLLCMIEVTEYYLPTGILGCFSTKVNPILIIRLEKQSNYFANFLQ